MYQDPFFVSMIPTIGINNVVPIAKIALTVVSMMCKGIFIPNVRRYNIYDKLLQVGNNTVRDTLDTLNDKPSLLAFLQNTPSSVGVFFGNVFGTAKNVFRSFISFRILSKLLPKDHNIGELLSGVKLITTDMDLQLAKISRIVATSDFLQQELNQLLISKDSSPIEHTELVAYFRNLIHQNADHKDIIEEFMKLWIKFMNEHGHRGSGEIDITTTRFCEDCSMIIRIIINSCIRTEEHADAIENFSKKKQQVHETIQHIHAIVRQEKTFLNGITFGIWGRFKAIIILQLIQVVRNYFSVRETPKYLLIKLMTSVKLHLLKLIRESGLVEAGVFDDAKDIYWLYYEELLHICESYQRDGKLETQHVQIVRETITKRKGEYEKQKQWTAPRAVTSYGEYLDVRIKQEHAKANKEKYKGQNVLVGSGVSTGIAVGRVCIVLDPNTASLKPGEVLVVRQSDPGYNPLFLNCVALISEAGGYLTHGSVVARELNLPAVVGIDNVCQSLKQGQLVQVNGDEGIVTILEQ